MNVWTAIYPVNRAGSDVAVASSRRDDPQEWERAHYGALRNMHRCQKEALRWGRIADGLVTMAAEVRSAEVRTSVERPPPDNSDAT